MAYDDGISSENMRHPEVTYDRTDLSARSIISFLVWLAVSIVVAGFVLWGLYAYLDNFNLQRQRGVSPISTLTPPSLAPAPAGPLETGPATNPQRFPEPRLQPDPVADLNKFRVREEQLLNSYGYVDEKAGVIHIPIEEAMQKLAQQGLPVRQDNQESKTAAPKTKSAAGK